MIKKLVIKFIDKLARRIGEEISNYAICDKANMDQAINTLAKRITEEISNQSTCNKSAVDDIGRQLADTIAAKISEQTFITNTLSSFYHYGSPAYDPANELIMDAMRESALFIKQNMAKAVVFQWRHRGDYFLKYVLSKVSKDGLLLGVGVYNANSINYFANLRPQQEFHGFYSFEGLPEDWSGWQLDKGTFSMDGMMPKVRENVTLHKGWFEKTIPEFSKQHKNEKIAFMHIDCDTYVSTKNIFTHLGDRLQSGTVIVFDEYFNYPSWKEHEYKAFSEFCDANNIKFHYCAFCYEKAAVIIDSIG